MSARATWSNLRSYERRLVVGVAVVLFAVANFVWVIPRFYDWSQAKARLNNAHKELEKRSAEVKQMPEVQKKIKKLEMEGSEIVAPEDQASQFQRVVTSQAIQSGVNILSSSRASTRTNDAYFLEQLQTYQVQAGEEQLVDFLFALGSGDSMIRARGMSVQPNPARQLLSGNIDLVASYQKKPPPKPAATPVKPVTPAAKTATTPTAKPTPPPQPAKPDKASNTKKT